VPRPPLRITPRILSLSTEIGRLIGRCEGEPGAEPPPRLRRSSRVRSVQGSVAVEGNTLSLDQVTAILDGKRVAGPAREIREVKNAIAAYALGPRLRPGSTRDILRAHAVMMDGLIDDAGRWRARDVGVIRGSKVGHIAPGAPRVPALMRELLAFIARDRETPALVRACVAHYEIEFIHPFSDGNGRIGRLWQHVILLGESPAFAFVPVESIVKDRQAAYYATLAACDRAGDSTAFVEFALDGLKTALAEVVPDLRPLARPRAPDASQRLAVARQRFGRNLFTRRDYLDLHPGIATATASRDLKRGTDGALLEKSGHKATARYRFTRR
jgi:Fic family protein